MNLVIHKGKPTDTSGRLQKEIRVYEYLDNLGIEYYRIDHDLCPSMKDLEEINAIFKNIICKNLLLCNTQRTKFYLLMMPKDKRFYTKIVSKLIGSSRLSVAEDIYLEKYLDVTPGSVSIMGLMNDKENVVQLIIDSDVIKNEYIGCHPCINTSSLKILTKDILEKFLVSVNHKPIIIDIPNDENN